MKKNLFIATFLVLLFFTGFSFAAKITAPTSIASNVNWSFSVLLDSGNTDVLLDGQKIVTAYSNGETVIDPFYRAFVLDARVIDDVLYVSYLGVPKGTYEIEATGAQKVFVKVFNPLSEEIEAGINTKLEEATLDKEKTLAQINTLEQDILEMNRKLDEKNSEISSLKSELSETITSIGELDSRISNDSTSTSKEINGITSRLLEIESEVFPEPVLLEEPIQEPGLLAGFYSLEKEYSNWIGLFLVLIVAFFAIGLFARKRFFNSNTVFEDFDSAQTPQPNEISQDKNSNEEDEGVSDRQEVEEEPESKSRWAFKD